MIHKYSIMVKQGQRPTLNKISFPFPVHILILADTDRLTSFESADKIPVLLKDTYLGHVVNSQKLLQGLE